MGFTIRDIYDDNTNTLALTFGKLASPCRLTLITLLHEKGTMSTKELAGEVQGLSVSTISQHLAELRAVNLVRSGHTGTTVLYSLDRELWKHIGSAINLFFAEFEDQTE